MATGDPFDLGPLGLDDFDNKKINQPYIVDLVTLEILHLQSVPLEISVNPELGWYAVATPGRNIPLYQYTGGEEIIEFGISWYADRTHKQDALRKVKWLRALSQNDGYANKPHPIQFIMGDLFKKAKFIITAAPYKMSMFDRSKGMMPCLITQDITLKKISEKNVSRADLLDINT
jgi:hypothetical protein